MRRLTARRIRKIALEETKDTPELFKKRYRQLKRKHSRSRRHGRQ